MGMNVGSSGGSGDPEVMMDINTTPLIDVMLVLLVMLIITIPIQLHSVTLEMPQGKASDQKPQKLQIDIDERSVIYWQGEPVEKAVMEAKMKEISALPDQPQVHIRPNKASQYAVFANVLASSKRLGLTKIAVVGAEQFIQ